MDLHERFAGWVTAGARDELPRDMALHASGCEGCLGIAAAVDALALVDPAEADMPPVRIVVGPRRTGRPIRAARAGIAAVAVVLTVAAGFVAGGSLFDRVPESIADVVSPTPAGAVLGGQGSPAATPTASPEAETPAASPSASATAWVSPVPGANPTMGGGPPPLLPGTPAPTTAPTAAPTATPTPSPTPVAPPPTPSPSCPIRLPTCPSPSLVPLP